MKNQSGKAMIELAVILPFFLIMFLGIVDLSFIIQKDQVLSVIVRETGNVAYRNCRTSTNGDSTINCLKSSVDEVFSFANQSGGVLSGVELVVRSWQVNSDKGFTTSPTLKGEYATGNTLSSKFTATQIFKLKSYDSSLRETVITVEAKLDNTKKPFYSFARDLYESMIF